MRAAAGGPGPSPFDAATTARIAEQARAHALARYPEESCGIVVDGAYVACANVARKPRETFEIHERVWLDYPGLQAVVHSHAVEGAFDPARMRAGMAPDAPSLADQQGQLASGVPWGIVLTDGGHAAPPFWWGDFLLDQPLNGRLFRHYTADCYQGLTLWFWQKRGRRLPAYPRRCGWWTGDGPDDLLAGNFAGAGFVEMPDDRDARVGDVVLARVPVPGQRRAPPLNHCGVYAGGGEFFHHMYGRLSATEPLGRRIAYVEKWLRHREDLDAEVTDAGGARAAEGGT